jgi:hypothetical protein
MRWILTLLFVFSLLGCSHLNKTFERIPAASGSCDTLLKGEHLEYSSYTFRDGRTISLSGDNSYITHWMGPTPGIILIAKVEAIWHSADGKLHIQVRRTRPDGPISELQPFEINTLVASPRARPYFEDGRMVNPMMMQSIRPTYNPSGIMD